MVKANEVGRNRKESGRKWIPGRLGSSVGLVSGS